MSWLACRSIAPHAQAGPDQSRFILEDGGIVRGPVDRRRLALVFTGHEFAEGATTILNVLAQRRAKASFFLTGVFLRNPAFREAVKRMVREGHLVGPHSDAHLLYCPWTGPKVTLVPRDTFLSDLEANIRALQPYGIARDEVRYFLPSYEWYNREIVEWTREAGLTLVCHTKGTRSNADYTEEGTRQFVATVKILESIYTREREDPQGLNGFLLLLHVGAGPRRKDKLHYRFAELVEYLVARGYELTRVDTLLETKRR
ncbi:MAG TPA: polysaccharide deacetylase family protein [Vicinamibacterales bacterium]